MKKTMFLKFVAIFFLMAVVFSSCGDSSAKIDPIDEDPIKYPTTFSVTVTFDVPSGYVVISSTLGIANNKIPDGKLFESTGSNTFTVTFSGQEVKNYWNTPLEIALSAAIRKGAAYKLGLYVTVVTIKEGYVFPKPVMVWE